MKTRKDELRERLRQQRRQIPEELRWSWSQEIVSHLESWFETIHADQVFAYRSFRDEVAINESVDRWSQIIPVNLPVAYPNGQILFYRYHQGDLLIPSTWGIEEPANRVATCQPTDRSIILVPALAINERGHRLGYGGGYYDRFLITAASAIKVGLIFSAFRDISIPTESHDIPVDYLCDEHGIQKI